MSIVHSEVKAAEDLLSVYCDLLGYEKPKKKESGPNLLAEAIEVIESHARGEGAGSLAKAIEICEQLHLLADDTARSLDVREPVTALEHVVAAAVAQRRLTLSYPVAAQHLALLGGVGASAVRMALKDGPLLRASREGIDEDDRRVYVTAESARRWLDSRR